jgi:hypothetical protein
MSLIEPLITIFIPLNAEFINYEFDELAEFISLCKMLSHTDIIV